METRTETNSPPLVGYQLCYPDGQTRPTNLGALYNYTVARNGVFLRAQRPGLEVSIPIAECEIRGLADWTAIERGVRFTYPRVPRSIVRVILDLSRTACVAKGAPVEALFHLIWLEDEKRWRLDKPEQVATATSVRPTVDGYGSSYSQALIELHSHHEMEAFFSSTDDADEQGFRIYAVIGEIFSKPKLRVRVGCYGQFWELPAGDIFELPEQIQDARDNG